MEIEKVYEDALRNVGMRIKQIRLQKGLTQLDLEVLTRINNGDLSRIENGKINFEFLTIVKIATALEVEISDLF